MAFPVTVQLGAGVGGVSSKKLGWLAVNEHLTAEGTVLFSVPVTVTHVPGGPVSGKKFSVSSLKSLVPAWAGGTKVEERDRSIDESSSTTRYVEATLRTVKLKHVTVIPQGWII